VTYAILARLDHARVRKSLIFVANLRGQPRKCAIFGAFRRYSLHQAAIFPKNPAFRRTGVRPPPRRDRSAPASTWRP
jgi:hypothetical protein